MIGQWTTFGGGLPPVAKDARDLVRKFCREDGRTFATSEQPTATQEPTLEAA
jgi:hypothetical protein